MMNITNNCFMLTHNTQAQNQKKWELYKEVKMEICINDETRKSQRYKI